MKDQNKTRFAVGMPVIAIIDGESFKTNIESINYNGLGIHYPILIEYRINEELKPKCVFTNEGYSDVFCEIPMLYTLPEYEALKALTDSFVDGTFGKEQPKFEPQKDEPVIYKGTECYIEGIQNWYILKYPNGFESVRFVSPVEGYPYANGFCIPLLKEEQKDNPIVSTKPFETLEGGELEKPTPISGEWKETIDLLDENGQPVYFSEGMEVGCIYLGKKGKVSKIVEGIHCVKVTFDDGLWQLYSPLGKLNINDATTLYPIEQYNQIQLPNLKPIQVAKPKEDVIGLPSWFKGGVVLERKSVFDYIISLGRDIEDIFDGFIEKAYIELKECVFYSCMIKDLGSCNKSKVLIIDFVYRNTYYTMVIDFNNLESKHTELLMAYSKNGKDISEKLC